MKALRFITCLVLALSANAMAQTYQQKGTVRMITTSASSPLTPVAGVKVQVGNNVSKATGSNGAFTMQVTKQFQLNGVTPNDEYHLALPTKGKAYSQSENDLDVVVTTKAKKEDDYKRLYSDLKKKYRQQTAEINRLREELCDKLDEMKETDVEYAKVKAQRDSIQTLYKEYVENTAKIDEEIKKIAEELAITDYISLDSIKRRIYELKTQGEYESINKMLQRVVWHGDRSAAFKKQDDIIAQKELELKEEKLNRETMLRLLLDDIESFKMRHLNDSVSECYKILTDAAPDNWDYLNEAGIFECNYVANFEKALSYHFNAHQYATNDSLDVSSLNSIGHTYYCINQFSESLKFHTLALTKAKAVLSESNPEIAMIYNNLGTIYDELGDYSKAFENFNQALKLQSSTLNSNYIDIATTYNNLGSYFFRQGNFQKALENAQKALTIRLDVYDSISIEVADTYGNLSVIYTDMENFDKALEYGNRALSIRQKLFGENHPDVALSYDNIGAIYYETNNFTKALDLYKKSLRIRIEVFGDSSLPVAYCYNNMSVAYTKLNDSIQALRYCEQTLNIKRKILGDNHPDIAVVYNNIGGLYKRFYNYDLALASFEKALSIYTNNYGENHPDIITSLNNIADLFLRKQDYEQALFFYNKSLSSAYTLYQETHPLVANIYNNIGRLYVKKEQYELALYSFEKAYQILQRNNPNHNALKTIKQNIENTKERLATLNKNTIKTQ